MKLMLKLFAVGCVAVATSASTPTPNHEDSAHHSSSDASTLNEASDHVEEDVKDWQKSSHSAETQSDESDSTSSSATDDTRWKSDESASAHEKDWQSDTSNTENVYKSDHTEKDTEWFSEDANQSSNWSNLEETKLHQTDTSNNDYSKAGDNTWSVDDHVFQRTTEDTAWMSDRVSDWDEAAWLEDVAHSAWSDEADWRAWNSDTAHAADESDWSQYRDAAWAELNKHNLWDKADYTDSRRFADVYPTHYGYGYTPRADSRKHTGYYGGGYGGYGGYAPPPPLYYAPPPRPSYLAPSSYGFGGYGYGDGKFGTGYYEHPLAKASPYTHPLASGPGGYKRARRSRRRMMRR